LPEYKGGYLYNGVRGTTTVAEATLTITPLNGPPITVITGPDGMFFLGTIDGTTVTPYTLNAPYDVCVSKCPNTVCAAAGTHPNADDCRICHNQGLKIYLP
jgi:hypothetical protein